MAKSGNSKVWPVILLLVTAIAGGAYYWWARDSRPVPQFVTSDVTRGDIVQSVTATGTLQSFVTVNVSSQISGLVCEVDVDFNSVVKKGAMLARIDPSTYQSTLNQAEAQLTNTEANMRLVELNTRRTRDLFKNHVVSQQDLDQADALLTQAQAQLKIQQAVVATAKVNLAYCDIFSPIDGIVLDREADVGNTVAASLNAPTLFTIAADLTQMQINAAVAEGDIGNVKVGQDVIFTVDAYPGRQFQGTVAQIRNSPATTQNVVTYPTMIDVANTDLKLRPGMTASVSIIIARRTNALRLPNAALRVQMPPSLLPAPADGAKETLATNDQIYRLMLQAGINPRNRHIAPEALAKLVQLAKDRGLVLPDRIVHPDADNGVTTRVIYELAGTPDAPKVIPITVKIGITDGAVSEIVDGFSGDASVITNVWLPGSDSDDSSGPANPFAAPRRR